MDSSRDFLPDIGTNSVRNRNSREKSSLMINTRPERGLVPVSSDKILPKYSRDRDRGSITPLGDGFSRELEIGSAQRLTISKEVSSGVSYLDMSNRIRDIEKKFIDLASSMDRRIQTFIEENPQKILRQLRSFEEKDSALWKETHQKQSNFQDHLNIQKDNLKENLDNLNDALMVINRRIDNSEYRVVTVERGLESFNKLKINNLLPLDNRPANANGERSSDKVETELKLLREALNQERQKREVFFGDVMKQYQEVFSFVHKNEGELLHRIQKHKEDVLEQNRLTKEQQKKLEEIKLEKLLGDNEYLRNIYKTLESKMSEEVNKRLHHEFENKQWMEHKIGIFRDEIRSDEKDLLEGEKRFAEQMHDSIASLNQIIKNSKEQLEANIAATQTIFNENVKSLSQTMNVLKENVYAKLNLMDNTQKDQHQKLQETNSQFHQHAQNTNATLEKEFQRIEKVTLKFEEILNEKTDHQNEKIHQFDVKTEQWRKEFEEKNLKVLVEMGNALKSLKNEFGKEKKDTIQRFDRSRDEMDHLRESNEKLKLQMDEHVKNLYIQFDYKVNESSLKVSEELKVNVRQLEDTIQKTNQATYEKASKEIKLGLLNLDKKATAFATEEVRKTREDLLARIKDIKEQLGNEFRGDLETLRKAIVHVQDEKNREVQELRHDLLDLRKENESMRSDFRERMKDQVVKFESKLKIHADNMRIYVSERLAEYRKEVDDKFKQHTENFLNEISLARDRNKQLMDVLHEQVKNEVSKQSREMEQRFLDLLEEERKVRGEKDTEQVKQLLSVKTMLMETINTKIESTQALARALVNEEAAERAKADEHLLKTLQQRIKALDESLRKLIATSIEELRLEFDEKLRSLEIKFEEFKLWTIYEFNKIIDDFEEYVRHTTARFHVIELEMRTEAQLTMENFQKVDIELIRIDEQRDKDMAEIDQKFKDIKDEQQKEIERLDQRINQNEENRLNDMKMVKEQFEEAAAQREKDMNGIQLQFSVVEEKRQEDLQKLESEIEERRKKNEEFKEVMDEHNKQLESHEKQITETKEALNDAVDLIKNEISKNIQEIEDKLMDVDEKFTNAIDDVHIKMQVKEYIEGLYRKAKEEEDNLAQGDMKRKFQKYDEQFRAVADRFEETDKALETFEDKTESNFKIAEEMLLSHSNYITGIDGRLTAEELLARVTLANLEERTALEFAQLETQVNLLPEEMQKKFEKRVGDLQRSIEEDIIPSTILKMNEALGDVKNQIGNENAETKNFLAQRLSEHERTLISHTDLLNSHDQRIFFAEENFDTITEVLQKYAKRIGNDEQELEKTKEELTLQIEAKYQTFAAIQKAIEKNLVVTVQDIIGDLENIIFSSEKSGVKPGHLQEIKNALIPDVREFIRADVPDIVDKQAAEIVNKKITEDVPKMIDARYSEIKESKKGDKLREKEELALAKQKKKEQKEAEKLEKEQKEKEKDKEKEKPADGQEPTANIDKAEVEAINARIKEIEQHNIKENDELKAKMKDLEEKYTELEKKLKEGGGQSGDGGQINEEVKEELKKFKNLIDEIQKEQKEKEKQTDEMNRKLDNVNDNVKGIQNTLKDQLEKNAGQVDQNQKVVTGQLERLFEQFQSLQDKLYVDREK